jgi:hypothetical protein
MVIVMKKFFIILLVCLVGMVASAFCYCLNDVAQAAEPMAADTGYSAHCAAHAQKTT